MYKKPGFTIVELLIVIVVIGILAAVSMVAYRGIQMRAQNIKTTQAVANYVKVFQLYATDHGGLYPVAGSGAAAFACLGTTANGTRCGQMSGSVNSSTMCGSTSIMATTHSTTLATALGNVTLSTPTLSDQIVTCSGQTYSGGYYFSIDGRTATITYLLRGDQKCDQVGGLGNVSKSFSSQATVCTGDLPQSQ